MKIFVDSPYYGSVVILGGLSLVNSLHAYTFASLKRAQSENGISLKINSFRYGNDPKILPLTITRQYAAFISFSCLYYSFNCLTSYRLTVVERTLDIC